MNKLKEFADKLTKSVNFNNIPQELIIEAKENEIVIVYGSSDDLIEFDGAIYDEADCFEGGIVFINSDGLIENNKKNNHFIQALWCDKDNEWAWSYITNIKNIEHFKMYDDGEKYCLGFVFYKKELV